ncbi:DUF2171 domain-containing protein [Sphingomonas sp. QA11]|uniref:DUF2171 domain-containing protein n=1 Tax=Sphingomonas sp. QA11 TaxID=2950605 RepID=UPI0023492DEB|nr:DUF2171 domain-containing protein [Sphingomonas sp. QA11]WCM27758.1 DUF2171 domain-containing protein [Sphingomonas sp. QA11]
MDNGRYLRNTNPQADYSDSGEGNYTRDYGSGQDYTYSSAREYRAAGELGRGRDGDEGRRDYGPRDYGNSGYAYRDQRGLGQGQRRYTRDSGFQGDYRGSYGADGHRFTETGDRDYRRRDTYGQRRDRERPEGYDYQDRDFFSRAGDEVRSWFGDEEAERRRELDSRYDERHGGGRQHSPYARDDDYHSWRRSQIDALDRDYDEYRHENRSKFENEFGSWRTERQTQRSALSKVSEHMEVLGSDGEHVGTVDKVRGDRIILTKSDVDAGGRHHSIPSRWIESVDDKVKIRKTAEDAKAHWRDEERSGAFFNENRDEDSGKGRHTPNRSFSGT